MDENRSVKPSVKVKKSHIVMLILACVCLLIALKGAKDLLEVFLLAETPTYPSDVGPGGLFAVLLGEWLEGGITYWNIIFLLWDTYSSPA